MSLSFNIIKVAGLWAAVQLALEVTGKSAQAINIPEDLSPGLARERRLSVAADAAAQASRRQMLTTQGDMY